MGRSFCSLIMSLNVIEKWKNFERSTSEVGDGIIFDFLILLTLHTAKKRSLADRSLLLARAEPRDRSPRGPSNKQEEIDSDSDRESSVA